MRRKAGSRRTGARRVLRKNDGKRTGRGVRGEPALGTVGWLDLTVPNADEARDFYAAVIGWNSLGVDMGGYSDYCMTPPRAEAPAAGICHSRGVNRGLPRCWLVYFTVKDVARAVREVEKRGGRVVRQAGPMGPMGRFAVIQDPAGAVCALHEAPKR